MASNRGLSTRLRNVFGKKHTQRESEKPDFPPQVPTFEEHAAAAGETEPPILKTDSETTMLVPGEYRKPDVQKLIAEMKEWMNGVLAGQRLIVRNLFLDMYDGQILSELAHQLIKTEQTESLLYFTVREERQKEKLEAVLDILNAAMGMRPYYIYWSVETIFSKDVVSTLRLIYSIMKHFAPEVKLPAGVTLELDVIEHSYPVIYSSVQFVPPEEVSKLTPGLNKYYRVVRKITPEADPEVSESLASPEAAPEVSESLASPEAAPEVSGALVTHEVVPFVPDAFDIAMQGSPEEVKNLKTVLMEFATSRLQYFLLTENDYQDLSNGVVLIYLCQVLGGFLLRMDLFKSVPFTDSDKEDNVRLVLTLMDEFDCLSKNAKLLRAESVVNNLPANSGLRLLHCLYTKFKDDPIRVVNELGRATNGQYVTDDDVETEVEPEVDQVEPDIETEVEPDVEPDN